MNAFILRFTAAGLLVASLPIIAKPFGNRIAGVLLLFPAVSIAGLVVLGLAGGTGAVSAASGASVRAIPAVLAFLVTVHIIAQHASLAVSLIAGTAAWLVVAGIATVIA